MKLRPYQSSAITRLSEGFGAGQRRQLLVAPTGAGKTVQAAELMRRAAARGTPTMFLAPRRELIYQASGKLDAFGVEHGILMAGEPEEREQLVQVCSVETLRRRPWMPPAKLVIVDEAHQQRFAWLLPLLEDPWLIGMTATPWRMNGRGLEDDFDAIVLAATPSELIEDDYLMEPVTYAPAAPDTSGLHIRGGDFSAGDLDAMMNRRELVGDIVQHWKSIAGGRRTVAFATSVEHSKAIAEAFCAEGVRAVHVDGKTPYKVRSAALESLARGDLDVVSNCEIVTYGWDCPPVACAVVARPTASLAMWIQMAGRILRPHPGKLQPVILDHAGNALDHGLVTEDREYRLDRPAEGRRKGVERTPAALRTCVGCYALLPAASRVCKLCGELHVPKSKEIKTGEGKLEELESFTARRLRMRANSRLLEKAMFWVESEEIRREKGYKRGWSKRRFQTRFGHWPTREVMESRAEREGGSVSDHGDVRGTGGDEDLEAEHGRGEPVGPTRGGRALRRSGASRHQRDREVRVPDVR